MNPSAQSHTCGDNHIGSAASETRTTAPWRRRALATSLTAGLAIGTLAAPQAHASDLAELLPEGSSISAPLNQGSSAISPWNDFIGNLLRQWAAMFPSPIPGPFIGSSGFSSSDRILDFNLRR